MIQTINSLFDFLFSSINNQVYSTLDDITFLTTDIIHSEYFENIFGTSTTNGILLIANSFLFGFILYYLTKLLLADFSIIQTESPFSFLLKLLLVAILLNCSFFLCEQLVWLFSILSSSIRELGEILFNKNICFSELVKQLNSTISVESTSFNLFSFDGLMKSTISISLLTLLFSYSLRYVFVKILILLSPFAILTLLAPSTYWFFKAWFRNFLSLLIVQSIISLVLLLIFSQPFGSDDFISQFICVRISLFSNKGKFFYATINRRILSRYFSLFFKIFF